MSDVVKELTQLLRDAKMVPVFWMCPNGCNGTVVWNQKKTNATCQVCGRRKK